MTLGVAFGNNRRKNEKCSQDNMQKLGSIQSDCTVTAQVQGGTAELISLYQTLPHTLQQKEFTCHTDVEVIIKFIANMLNQINSIVETIYFFLPFLTSRI